MLTVICGERSKGGDKMREGAANISVMVARCETDVAGVAQGVEPGASGREFCRKTDVEDVTGHGDVVWTLRLKIGDKASEDLHVVRAVARLCPIEISGEPLTHQLAQSWSW